MGAGNPLVRRSRRFHRILAAATVLLVAGTVLGGCAIPTWKYKPVLKKGQVGERPQIHVAVPRFAEGRRQIDMSNGKVFLTYVPILPYVEDEMQMTDEGAKEFARKMNAAPQPEFVTLAGRALYDELKASKAFDIVDYDPEYYDDYDLLFKGKLTSTLTKLRYTSYGLGMAGVLLWLMPLPVVRLNQFFEYELNVTDGAGKEIATASAVSDDKWWAGLYYGMTPEKAYAVLGKVMQQTNQKVLEQITPKIDEYLGGNLEAIAQERRWRYYRKMDPGLTDFRDVVEGGGRNVAPEQRGDYEAAYRLKLDLLEGLRHVERSFADQEQEAKTAAFNQEMENIAAEQRRRMQEAIQQAAASMASAAGGMSSMSNLGNMNDFQKAMAIASEVNKARNTMNELEAQANQNEQAAQQHYSAMLQTKLEKFQTIGGNRAEVRSQWIERYRSETPRFEDIARGRWNAEYGFDIPLPEPVQMAAEVVLDLKDGEGGVIVTSTPASSDLYINGQFFGMTPSTTLTFPLGTELDIQVSHEGYEPFARKLALQSSNVLRLNAALKPGSGATDAAPEPAPEQALPSAPAQQ